MNNDLPQGFIFKKPHDNAPDFVKGKVSIKVEDFEAWMKANAENGWLNLDLLESKDGKYYSKLNDFKPNNAQASQQYQNNP